MKYYFYILMCININYLEQAVYVPVSLINTKPNHSVNKNILKLLQEGQLCVIHENNNSISRASKETYHLSNKLATASLNVG